MKPVAFDNTMLSLLLNPNGSVPIDPTTKVTLTHHRERAQGLVTRLQTQRRKIIIPAPAGAELLTVIGPQAQQYLDIVAKSRWFEVAAFDGKCAVELATLNREVFAKSDRKTREAAYQKVKFDRQILAIAKASGCEIIYTDDQGLTKRARMVGLDVIASWDLPIPIDSRQLKLELEPHDDIPEAEGVDTENAG